MSALLDAINAVINGFIAMLYGTDSLYKEIVCVFVVCGCIVGLMGCRWLQQFFFCDIWSGDYGLKSSGRLWGGIQSLWSFGLSVLVGENAEASGLPEY